MVAKSFSGSISAGQKHDRVEPGGRGPRGDRVCEVAVDAHARVSIPNSAALAAATATTRSLNECVGFVWSSFSKTSPTPSARARRGAETSGVQPGAPAASSGAGTGRSASYRQRECGPASIRSRETLAATRSQS